MCRTGNLYICDRCYKEIFVDRDNCNGCPPSDWIRLDVAGELHVYLCPDCYGRFKDFMNNRGDAK